MDLLSVYYLNTPGVCTNLGHPIQDLIEVIFGTPNSEFETFVLIIWMNNLYVFKQEVFTFE